MARIYGAVELVELEDYDFELEVLEDIDYDVENDRYTNDQQVIEENIIYILKREKLWKKGYSIVFPCGATQEIDAINSTYCYDFEIFLPDHNTIVANITAQGSLMVYREKRKVTGVQITDMNLSLGDCNKDFFERTTDKCKVDFD